MSRHNEAGLLEEMRGLTKEYIQRNDGEPLVKQFLQEADDEIMLQFLKGRKYRAQYAWDTLRRYAEVKLVKYPEFFTDEIPPSMDRQVLLLLKHRDSKGRRILIFDFSRWDADQHSMLDICKYFGKIAEKIIRDKDAMENGLVVIQQCSDVGLKHCLHYSLKHSYPLRYKDIYYVNTPYMLNCTVTLAKLFFPKKLKERLIIGSTAAGFKYLHENIYPDILPGCVGGKLDYEEAIDPEMTVR